MRETERIARTPVGAASGAGRAEQARVTATREAQRVAAQVERERQHVVQQTEETIRRASRTTAEHRIRDTQQVARATAQIAHAGQGRFQGTGGGAFFGGSILGFAGAGPFASAVGVGLGLSIFALTSRVTEGARAWVDYASKLENAKIAFSTMLGSVQLADRHLRELQSFALTTPFQFDELIDASQRMQALGFTSEQVIPILRDVGNAVAAAGGGSERLDRVTLALAQMQSKGRVATQELNQLAEAGIGGFKILEAATGKSRAELVKMVEAGEVSSKVFLDAFQKFSQANFGGLMEKQSRTFTGAISNIRDALLTTANTAFDPLFRSISGITDRIATEMQSGKPALASAGAAIFDGMIEAAGAAGGNMAASLIENFGRRISDPSEWSAFVKRATILGILDPLFRGIASGIGDIEDLIGIGVPTGPITQALVIPDLKTPLANLSQQQREVSESAKKAGEMINDLALKLIFYGQNTEKAAVQQRLLAIGMEALTSAEGRRAIQLAELIDKQRLSAELNSQQTQLTKDLAAITESKYRNAFESLSQAIRDSVVQMAEFRAAEIGGLTAIERFNLGLGATIEGLLSAGQASQFSAEQVTILRAALLSARTAMINLTSAQEDAKRKADTKKLLEQQADLFRSLRGMEVDLTRQLRQVPTDEIQRLAEQLEGLSFLKVSPGGLDLFVEKLRAGALDAQQATALISTAIIGAQGDLGTAFDKTTQRIINLFLHAQQLSDFLIREEATERYTQLVEQLESALIGDVIQTNEARLAKELLKREYDGLTMAQREHLQQLAREVDVAERVRIAEERRLENLREIASDIGRIFADVFQQIGESSDRFWDGLRRQALRFIGDIQEQVFTGLFESLLTGEARRGTGLAGTLADRVLGLFGVKFSNGDLSVVNNTKAMEGNTAAINALTQTLGGTAPPDNTINGIVNSISSLFNGMLPPRSQGGLLRGPGTGMSDSIVAVNQSGIPIARVADHEYVIRESVARRLLPELEYINKTGQIPPCAGACEEINQLPALQDGGVLWNDRRAKQAQMQQRTLSPCAQDILRGWFPDLDLGSIKFDRSLPEVEKIAEILSGQITAAITDPVSGVIHVNQWNRLFKDMGSNFGLGVFFHELVHIRQRQRYGPEKMAQLVKNKEYREALEKEAYELDTQFGEWLKKYHPTSPCAGMEELDWKKFVPRGQRAGGGSVEAGQVYQIHDDEFFRPNLNGRIYNLNQAQGLTGNQRDEVRVNVAVGQDAVDELVESHMRTPRGKRAMLLRAKANRKVGKLLFA